MCPIALKGQTFYIAPKNPEDSEPIANHLKSPEYKELRERMCGDGVERNMYEVTEKQLEYLRSRTRKDVAFTILEKNAAGDIMPIGEFPEVSKRNIKGAKQEAERLIRKARQIRKQKRPQFKR